MKKFICQTAIAAALIFAATSFKAGAQDEKLVYEKCHNRAIGIRVENAPGATYTIRDKKGNIVLQGTIKDNKTFFIPTKNMNKGSYQFVMGSLVLQEFELI